MDAAGDRRRAGREQELALYAGEGAKTDGAVKFANSDPRFIAFFCSWLRRFFDIDESRLRLRLYLHEELDIEKAADPPNDHGTRPRTARNRGISPGS